MAKVKFPSRQEWRGELEDLVRGASGGFLFGIPLLYTMEVWWIGSYTSPQLMLVMLAVTYVIVFMLNRTDGFRQMSPDSPLQAATDSIEALALGTVCVTIILILIREITPSTPLNEDLGKVVLEGIPFSLGVALARSVLKGDQNESESEADSSAEKQSTSRGRQGNSTFADIGATLVGSIFVAFNIAPTDEVTMLVAAVPPPWLIAIILASLIISYSIVFVAGFTTQQQRYQQQGLFQHPLTETIMSYLISLLAAALMLWFFQQLSPSDPWTSWLKNTLILGLPATIGGAAGRLAV